MSRPKLSLLILSVLALVLALVLIFSSSGTAPRASKPSLSGLCPPGGASMGCASGASAQSLPALPPGKVAVTRPVSGCKFPDVSSYQGHPDWAAAAGSICAAVAKAGEYSQDQSFAYNVSSLRALHIPWSAYWFVRACNQGPAFVSVLNAIGFRGDRDALRPVLDMEVPSARGCAPSLADAIHAAFGVWPIIYTAPGTWPGGSSAGLDVWEADYSSTLAPLPFSATVLAWQAWSPPYRYLHLPGLAYGDVSVDLHGFATALAFPAPVDPHHYAYYPTAHFPSPFGPLSERSLVEHYDGAVTHPVTYRAYLHHLRGELLFLARRDHAIAHRQLDHGKPSWGRFHRGFRWQGLVHRANGRTP